MFFNLIIYIATKFKTKFRSDQSTWLPMPKWESVAESKATYVWDLKVSHVPAPSNNSRADDGHSLNDVQICLIPLCTPQKTHAAPTRELLFLNEAAAAAKLSLSRSALHSRSPVSLIIPTLALTSYPAAAPPATALAERKNPSTNYNQFKWRSREEKKRARIFLRHAPRC